MTEYTDVDEVDGAPIKPIEPDEGFLACGDYGKGRLAATETILEAVRSVLCGS